MDEDKQPLPRMLTGEELVRRGRCAKETPLPELGLKEVTPDGSWLEEQKIKAALEARKTLLAVERIDKIGSLSHAEWRDNLRLAEVTKQVGGYWQYMGQKVNHTMYLRPEEALYLIETNCLLLRHNSVTVSFQKAHKLLLDDTMPLTKYKVYASLSRVGYKVVKHEKRVSNSTDDDYEMLEKHELAKDKESTIHVVIAQEEIEDADVNKPKIDNVNENTTGTSNDDDGKENKNSTMPSDDINVKIPCTDFVMCNQQNEPKESSTSMDIDQNGNENIPDLLTNSLEIEKTAEKQSRAAFTIDEYGVIRVNDIGDSLATIDTDTNVDKNITSNTDSPATEKSTSYSQHMINCYKAKYQKILNRKFKPLDPKSFHEKFKNVPDLSARQIITIKVPSEEYLPRNIFLNNTTYVLNLETVRAKSRRSSLSSASGTSSPRLRIRNSRSVSPRMQSRPTQTPQFIPRVNIFPQAPRPQQPASQFRTRFQFPNMFQRPEFFNFMPMYRFNRFNQFYQNTTNFMYRPRFVNTQNTPNYDEARKRQYQNMKTSHLNEIKDCARRLKHFSSPPEDSVISLKNLLLRFNEIYDEKMILDSDFDIVDSQHEIQTIELDDDDDEEVPKRQRKEDETFNEYLKTIKELAATLKRIDRKSQPTSKQKRSFCNLIRNFNNTYDTDYYLDSTGKVVDRKLVVLDTSSDSDVVIEDYAKTKKRKQKMVRNPFHDMKKLKTNIASTSKANYVQPTDENPTQMELGSESILEDNSKEQVEPRDRLKNFFDEKWLPSEQDFGKALPCSKSDAQLLDIIRFDTDIVENNWTEAKLKACYRMESHFHFYNSSELDHDVTIVNSSSTPLIGIDDDKFNDSGKVWENLRIISSNKDLKDTELRVDFDVYNRDVQNFKKTDPPAPHFRIVCVDESSPFPSGAEVRALHSNYSDKVSIIFAVVGIGSISYLQINPTELPLFVGSE